MERICAERLDGFEIMNSDQMSNVIGGRCGFLIKFVELIIRYGRDFIEGFSEGWNEGDYDYSF